MLDLSRTIPLYPALWYENPVRDICIQRFPSPQASNATQASPTLSHQPQNPNGTDTVGGDNNDENEEKASHLRICPKDSLIWTSGFWSVPLQKKLYSEKMEANYDCQKSYHLCTASYKIAAPDKLSSLVKSTSSIQASWIRMLVAPARSVAGHLVTSSMFLSWSHMQALPAKAQRINDSCT